MSKTLRNIAVIVALIAIVIVASSAAETYAATTGASLTLVAPVSGSIETGTIQPIIWKSSNYQPSTVRINVIRKVSSNPNRYEVVRTISAATKNDGTATWVPATTDIGSGLSIEIGCASSAVACQAGVSTTRSIAVVGGSRYANTASAYKAIEAMNNK